MRKVYDEAVKQQAPEEEVHARHILVSTEDEAKAIEDQLKKGADFATLAKERSKDPGAADGGDLGYFTKDQMVPEFADVAFKLDKGQISDPVHTQFGWHIIKIEDKRIKPTPTFDEVKGQIENYVARRAQADLVAKLRSAANIERLDKPQAPANPSALNPAAPAKKQLNLRAAQKRVIPARAECEPESATPAQAHNSLLRDYDLRYLVNVACAPE